MKEIYLDNAATTKTRKEVVEEMKPYFSEIYGNPSSSNNIGKKAKEAVENARERIAKILDCHAPEIIFTSSGTESNNLAIQGVAKSFKKGHIITTKVEHHSVLHACEYLEKQGFEVTYLAVDQYGMASAEQVKKAIKENTILVTIIYANNEIGTINPIKEISKICKEKKVLFHTDACQAGCSLEINAKELGVDFMTLNGSKIYGPKGTGILYVKQGTKIQPIIYGGEQEFGLRSGTENVPGIIGFAKALELCQKEKDSETKRLTKLRDKLIKELLEMKNTILNGHPEQRLPNNVNISFKGIEAQALLLYLDDEGIYASTGSACTSTNLEASHVIKAIGRLNSLALGTLRFSLGRENTEEEIDFAIKKIKEIIKRF